MPGAIVVKPGTGTGGASTFAQLAGDPNDNAALAAFVNTKVTAAVGAGGAAALPGVISGGTGNNTETGDVLSGGTGTSD